MDGVRWKRKYFLPIRQPCLLILSKKIKFQISYTVYGLINEKVVDKQVSITHISLPRAWLFLVEAETRLTQMRSSENCLSCLKLREGYQHCNTYCVDCGWNRIPK